MNAREAVEQARLEVDFLEFAATYQEDLEAAKQAVREARDTGDEAATASAVEHLHAAATEMNQFRHWARSTGKPRDPGPGSAVIRIGG